MSTFMTVLDDMKTWIRLNFGYLEIESVEVNPILFKHINQTIQKEILMRTIGDTEIRLIGGIRVIKSSNPMSGIHFKFKETPKPLEPEWFPMEVLDLDPAKKKTTG